MGRQIPCPLRHVKSPTLLRYLKVFSGLCPFGDSVESTEKVGKRLYGGWKEKKFVLGQTKRVYYLVLPCQETESRGFETL